MATTTSWPTTSLATQSLVILLHTTSFVPLERDHSEHHSSIGLIWLRPKQLFSAHATGVDGEGRLVSGVYKPLVAKNSVEFAVMHAWLLYVPTINPLQSPIAVERSESDSHGDTFSAMAL